MISGDKIGIRQALSKPPFARAGVTACSFFTQILAYVKKISGIAFQGSYGPNTKGILHIHGIIKEILKYKSKIETFGLFFLLISSSKLLTIFNRKFLEVCEKKLTFAPEVK
ncbi:MAG: hypothetical protein IJ882_07175 [Paludibacteraceae bacterium]|nr:hypothetical protein [Paludibacteraceae bacterium]MBR4563675.1 hypothetical protein [Paludibacteraceae bacterium]